MAVTAHAYPVALKGMLVGTTNAVWDWDTDTIKCALCTSSYTPQNTHTFFNNITNEVSGTGYTAGGVTLGSATGTVVSSTVQLDANDATWSSSTITARYAIVYKSTGTASTSPLIGYVDFGADVSTTSGTFTITWDATGVVVFTCS